MIISCPECATKFAIADAVLGERGRKVRCFKCGHAWHQMPENPPPPAPARRAQPPLMPPTSSVVESGLPLESEPVPSAPPPPRPDAGDLPLESARETVVDDFEIPPIAPPDDPTAFSASPHADDEDTGLNAVDVDALLGSRPEDIPKVLSKRMREDEKSGGWGKWVLILLVLGGLGAGLWYGRPQIVERFPATAPLYKALGVPLEILGEGLEFRGVSSEMVKEGKTPVLIVRGVVANVAKETRPVPLLRLVLLDSGGGTIQESYGKPRKDELDAGAQMGFQIRMEDPSAAAVRYEVTFAEAPAERAAPKPATPPPAAPPAPAQ
ncbi:conserved hypothetical protein [uncultured Alphaproteobacteria bacterium]|uniref:Zinc finger/thioredoxin putative domain-containing protein n=1 Tax=uncultured Alphaproteobacteria bacterium TaxID=91750 RepID=A0A212JTX8_9PROT|nr:conserved hypothetical protein [uncultured Alphaproteobacteria bacterium]